MAQVVAPSLKTAEPQSGSSAQLAPTIQQLLKEVDWPVTSLDGIAVSIGPGSFTGLRVGITTAKTLAYSLGKPIVGVNTMDVLAVQACQGNSQPTTIRSAINAQRRQLFVASYSLSPNERPNLTGELKIVDRAEWIQSLQAGDFVIGPGLTPLVDELAELEGITVVDEKFWIPTAETVGEIARQRLADGQTDDLWKLSPLYFRPSAAEEKRLKV